MATKRQPRHKHKERPMRELKPQNVPQFESRAAKRERLGLCPDCGAAKACYSCVTKGGWMSAAEQTEATGFEP